MHIVEQRNTEKVYIMAFPKCFYTSLCMSLLPIIFTYWCLVFAVKMTMSVYSFHSIAIL